MQKERLLQFQQSLGISMRMFESQLGLSNGAIKASSKITRNVIDKLKEKYPELNINWLLTGEGPMLVSSGHTISVDAKNSSVDASINKQGGVPVELIDEIRDLKNENKELKDENKALRQNIDTLNVTHAREMKEMQDRHDKDIEWYRSMITK